MTPAARMGVADRYRTQTLLRSSVPLRAISALSIAQAESAGYRRPRRHGTSVRKPLCFGTRTVVVIIGVLAAIANPAYIGQQERAKDTAAQA